MGSILILMHDTLTTLLQHLRWLLQNDGLTEFLTLLASADLPAVRHGAVEEKLRSLMGHSAITVDDRC